MKIIIDNITTILLYEFGAPLVGAVVVETGLLVNSWLGEEAFDGKGATVVAVVFVVSGSSGSLFSRAH